jgi:hypothetical protein
MLLIQLAVTAALLHFASKKMFAAGITSAIIKGTPPPSPHWMYLAFASYWFAIVFGFVGVWSL